MAAEGAAAALAVASASARVTASAFRTTCRPHLHRPSVPEVRVRKARPAKLIHPSRDREVEDEADLFVARVTVDTDGDVVGARMVKTRPGARGDQAANAIWTFRYLPALDDDGRPITSTFDQQFQIR